jgi:hypothetical protein
MYLAKKMYVKNWEYQKKSEQHKVTVKLGGKVRKDIKPERIAYIEEDVMYWRKANQIHKWFVDNIQKGVDDCGTYYVGTDKLQELLDICKQVLAASKLVKGKVANGYRIETDKKGEIKRIPILEDGKYIEDPTVAKELLPCQEGFFFGGTNYDEWYYNDLVDTVEGLEKLLAEEPKDNKEAKKGIKYWGEYYYHSSW